MQQIGKYMIITGIVLFIAGVVVFYSNKGSFLGNLPGDIKIRRDNFTFYAPITTMVIISVILSFLLWLISKLFK